MAMNLSELLEDVDVDEPSSMDKILVYVDELQLKDEEFMDLLVSKLHIMIVSWEQPPYQSQSRGLTRRLRGEGSESYRIDRFTKDESDRLKKNWRKFRRKFNVPDTPIHLARFKSKTKGRMPDTPQERVRHIVTSFLARGLQRTLPQVYKQFLTIYGHVQTGSYTKLEEKVVQICVKHSPKTAGSILSYILGRQPRQIYNKIKSSKEEVKHNKKEKFVPWTLAKASQLVNLLMKETGLKLSELKYRQIDRDIWLKLEEEMEYSMDLLKSFWFRKLHVQLFAQKDLKLNKIRRYIFQRLRSCPYKVWNDIIWKDFAKEFPDGCTPLFIYTVAYKTFRRLEKFRSLPLEEVIDYALKRVPSRTKKNWCLRRLTLDDKGNLIPLILKTA